MAGGNLFTPAEDAAILRIYRECEGKRGWATKAMRAVPGRSPQSISNRLALLNSAAQSEEISATGETDPNVRTVETPLSKRITSLDELLKLAKVDLEVWEVDRYVVNKWEVGAKLPDGQIVVEPLYQVKAWLKRIAGASLVKLKRELIEDIVADTARRRVRASRPSEPSGEPHMLEVCVMDLHVGKYAWAEETGNDYDSDIAERVATEAVAALLADAAPFKIERICLPIGNDFYHVDTLTGDTTAGTRQDRDTRYQRMYRKGRGIASWMIERCAERAPVDVVIVPGNHDETITFHLGEVLEAEFAKDPRVTVTNTPRLRKYYRYAKNLIGYTHGKDEQIAQLPQVMAVEEPIAWGETTHREFHLGHIHRGRKIDPVTVDDKTGVTLRFLRSLSGTDAWHARMGYVGHQRCAEAFLWRASGGIRAHFISPNATNAPVKQPTTKRNRSR